MCVCVNVVNEASEAKREKRRDREGESALLVEYVFSVLFSAQFLLCK